MYVHVLYVGVHVYVVCNYVRTDARYVRCCLTPFQRCLNLKTGYLEVEMDKKRVKRILSDSAKKDERVPQTNSIGHYW